MTMIYKSEELLNAIEDIGRATSNLFRLEPILNKFCHQIQSEYGYDFVAVQLIRPDEPVIESAYGRGIASEWAPLVKHPFSSKRELRDIQADIIFTYSTEVIAGWDDRFDKWVFDTYKHENLVRIFTPMFLVKDATSGKISQHWIDQFTWPKVKVQKFIAEENPGKCCGIRKEFSCPIHEIIRKNFLILPIGSVEAGFRLDAIDDFEQAINKITDKNASDLRSFVCVQSTKIKKYLLPYVLEKTVQNAVAVVGSDSASLHFDYNPSAQRYAYQVCAGKIDNRFLDLHPPRPAPYGMGRQAIRDNDPKFVPDYLLEHSELELWHINPGVFNAGVTAIAAFPLIVDNDEGVLYIHYHHDTHWITEEEIEIGKAFSTLAVNAIRHANAYTKTHNYLRQFIALHAITQTLSNATDQKELINHLAFSLLNIMAADIVTIWEYFEIEERLSIEPYIAGKLINKTLDKKLFATESSLTYFVAKGKNYYAEALADDPLLYKEDGLEKKRFSTLYGEEIKSTAGVLLRIGSEVLGAAFVHFRRNKRFSLQEKSIMKTFSSIAAMSMKDLRLLQALSSLKYITNDYKQILYEIIKRAVLITGANMGSIRRVDYAKAETVVLVIYPKNAEVNETYMRMQIEDGITGIVIKSKQPIIVYDVLQNEKHKAFFTHTRSAICVPLVDRNEVLGVINIESRRKKTFSDRDIKIMTSLAGQAITAINFA